MEKIKVFSASGKVIYSTDVKDVGRINEKYYFHNIVAAGNSHTKVVRKHTKTLEGRNVASDVVETYVPVMRGDVFVGAFEIYHDITSNLTRLNKLVIGSNAFLFTGALGLMGVVIFVSRKTVSTEEHLLRLSQAVEQITEAVILTGLDGTVLYVNRPFEGITGYTKDEAVGKRFHLLGNGDREKGYYKKVWDKIAGGEVWNGRIMNVKKDGSVYQEDVTLSPVRDTWGKVVNYVAIVKDVSYEVALEEQLQHSQKMESVGRLAGGVAHDVNNYLGAIAGFCELVKIERKDAEKVVKRIDAITDTAMRASSLTKQLLAFSRSQPPCPQVLSLKDVVGDMSDLMERIVGVDVEFEVSLERNVWSIWIDRSQIEQVLVNLLINAREAVSKGGKIRLEAANTEIDDAHPEARPVMKRGSYVMIAVSDTGVGIPDDMRERVFDPYFTTKEKSKHSGLGLSTIIHIIKQNGGYIWLNSEVGKGTVFKVFFPKSGEVVSTKGDEPVMEVTGDKKNRKILLVEDNDDLRESTGQILEAKGYDVFSVSTGEEGLHLIDEDKLDIDLLIVDVVLPGLNGRETADLIMKKNGNARVLYMSGYTDDVILHRGAACDEINFLQKPFSAGDLLMKVSEILS